MSDDLSARLNCPVCEEPCDYRIEKNHISGECLNCKTRWKRTKTPGKDPNAPPYIYEKWGYLIGPIDTELGSVKIKIPGLFPRWKNITKGQKKKRKKYLVPTVISAIVVIAILASAMIFSQLPLGSILPNNPSNGGFTPANAPEVKLLAQIPSEWVHQVTWSPDGKYFATASLHVDVYDAQTTDKVYTFDSVSWPSSIAFSPDSHKIAASDYDGFYVWNVDGWAKTVTNTNAERVESLTFSPDGKTLAGGIDKAVKLWDASNGNEIRTLPTESLVYAVAFSPDGKTLASNGGISGGDIKLWNPQTGQELKTLSGGSNAINSIAYSTDSNTLASAGYDNKITLWNPTSGAQLRVVTGHNQGINSVAFSPNNQLLASASSDLTVKLWDPSNGDELASLTGHENTVNSVAFSPNGTRLLSGATDDALRLWG